MPIEIKELHIEIKVRDEQNNSLETTPAKGFDQVTKAQIIHTCTQEVLEILKERQERW